MPKTIRYLTCSFVVHSNKSACRKIGQVELDPVLWTFRKKLIANRNHRRRKNGSRNPMGVRDHGHHNIFCLRHHTPKVGDVLSWFVPIPAVNIIREVPVRPVIWRGIWHRLHGWQRPTIIHLKITPSSAHFIVMSFWCCCYCLYPAPHQNSQEVVILW